MVVESRGRVGAMWAVAFGLLAAGVVMVPPAVRSVDRPAPQPHLTTVSDQQLGVHGIALGPAPSQPVGCSQLTAMTSELGRWHDFAARMCPTTFDQAAAKARVSAFTPGSTRVSEAVRADCSAASVRVVHRDCWVVVAVMPYYSPWQKTPLPGTAAGPGPVSQGPSVAWAAGTYVIFIDAQTDLAIATIRVANQDGTAA